MTAKKQMEMDGGEEEEEEGLKILAEILIPDWLLRWFSTT